MVKKLGNERGWKAKRYRRNKKIKALIYFSHIRLLILYSHILEILYLHISHPQNRLYLATLTHQLVLARESEARYVHQLGLGIKPLYYLSRQLNCLLLLTACLA